MDAGTPGRRRTDGGRRRVLGRWSAACRGGRRSASRCATSTASTSPTSPGPSGSATGRRRCTCTGAATPWPSSSGSSRRRTDEPRRAGSSGGRGAARPGASTTCPPPRCWTPCRAPAPGDGWRSSRRSPRRGGGGRRPHRRAGATVRRRRRVRGRPRRPAHRPRPGHANGALFGAGDQYLRYPARRLRPAPERRARHRRGPRTASEVAVLADGGILVTDVAERRDPHGEV